MKPTLYALLMALFLNACAPVSKLQKVEENIPCLGTVGKDRSTLFKKKFQKVGEPVLVTAIGVSLNSYAFDKRSHAKYLAYVKNQGKRPMFVYNDSIKVKPRFYKMAITDLVGLRSQFNGDTNKALKDYMATDKGVGLLYNISFVALPDIQETITNAKHFFIKSHKGTLVLEAHGDMGNTSINMASLEVFDFSTADVCWAKNKMGRYEVAIFLTDGGACPGDTEKNPHKLDDEKVYLKF